MKKIYLPGINGLRGIAALIVVIFHVTRGLTRFEIKIPHWIDFLFTRNSGNDAVTIFFAISGFLITYLLLNEKRKYPSVDIKKFYTRRILRIWPIYYLYLIVACGISIITHDKTLIHSIPYYIFFAGNIARVLSIPHPFYLIHYWSLGVEEQFYLFWPFIFKFFKKELPPIVSMLAVILLLLLFNYQSGIQKPFSELIEYAAKFQGIIFGSIAALLYAKNVNYFKFCFNKILQAISLILIPLMFAGLIMNNYFHDTVMSVLSVIIIAALIENKSYFLKTETKVLNYLGKISYGLYIWHPFIIWIFLRLFKNIIIPDQYLIWVICVGTPLISILIADISYRYFEVKFLKMKRKFVIIPSSNTADDI
jgi:peptidoglycan/LPS O-acetylase OafA/YrhL